MKHLLINRFVIPACLPVLLLVLLPLVVSAQTPYNDCASGLKQPLEILHSGWSHDYHQHRVLGHKQAGLEASDLGHLRLKWAFVFKNAVHPRSTPAITRQAIFLGSEEGAVFAIDQETACVYWSFRADAEIRSAISITRLGDDWLVFFGDMKANAYALDALTGKLVWKQTVDTHTEAVITGSPVYVDGKLLVPVSSLEVAQAANPFYNCCRFRGSINALDARTGTILWRYFPVNEEPEPTYRNVLGVQQYGPSGSAVWSSPTVDIDNRRLFIGSGQNYSSPASPKSNSIIAIELDTGKEIWARQTYANDAWNSACTFSGISANCPKEKGVDYDFGAPPVYVERSAAPDVIVAGQKSGAVYLINAENGEIIWGEQVGRGGFLGGVHWGLAADQHYVYVPMADTDIPVLPNTQGKPRSGLNKLALDTGKQLWHKPAFFDCDDKLICKHGLSAAITVIPGAVLAGGLDGILRAYDTGSGDIIWQYDTRQAVKGINGIEGEGGTLDAAPPTVVDGRIYLNSGYGGFFSAGSKAGNVFLVLEPEKQANQEKR